MRVVVDENVLRLKVTEQALAATKRGVPRCYASRAVPHTAARPSSFKPKCARRQLFENTAAPKIELFAELALEPQAGALKALVAAICNLLLQKARTRRVSAAFPTASRHEPQVFVTGSSIQIDPQSIVKIDCQH